MLGKHSELASEDATWDNPLRFLGQSEYDAEIFTEARKRTKFHGGWQSPGNRALPIQGTL